MATPRSKDFDDTIMAILGLQPGEKPTSLLSSLPSELAFNDLRDSARRHCKAEKSSAAAIHTVATKSAIKRPMGCTTLELTSEDWAIQVKEPALKSQVLNSSRCTDVSLGISSNSLTKNRSPKLYTKPHVFTQRLELLKVLVKQYHEFTGSDEEKRFKIYDIHGSMWVSNIVPVQWMIRRKGHEDDQVLALVLRAGPHFVEACNVIASGTSYMLATPLEFREWLVLGINDVEVAQVKPVVETNRLAWKRSSEWMSLVDATAYHTILSIRAQMLAQLCHALKLKQPPNLTHRLRVELFLKWKGCSEEYIKEVLAELPERKRRKKEDGDENEGDNTESESWHFSEKVFSCHDISLGSVALLSFYCWVFDCWLTFGRVRVPGYENLSVSKGHETFPELSSYPLS